MTQAASRIAGAACWALTLVLAATAWAQELPRFEVSAMTGGFSRHAAEGELPFSGLFVAEAATGWIYFQSSWEADPEKLVGSSTSTPAQQLDLSKFAVYDRESAPDSLAFSGADLWICSRQASVLWRISLPVAPGQRDLPVVRDSVTLPFAGGSCKLAASRTGVVAVSGPAPDRSDGLETVWFKPGSGAGWSPAPLAFEDLTDLEFSDDHRLRVLQGASQRLTSLLIYENKDATIAARAEEPRALPARASAVPLTAMATYNGILYLADAQQIYALIDRPDRLALVPVAPSHRSRGAISDITVSLRDLYLLDGGLVDRIERPVPVEVSLRSSAATAQQALVELYRYLGERGLLATRVARASRAAPDLAHWLFAERVLLAPRQHLEAGQESAGKAPPPLPLEDALAPVLCGLNADLCPSGSVPLDAPVALGQELVLPDLPVRSQLDTRTEILGYETVEQRLESLVFTPELRERVARPETLARLNPDFSEAEILAVERGRLTLPVEVWSVAAPVLAADFADPASPLRELERRFPGVALFSYESVAAKASDVRRQPDETTAEERCATLREARERLAAAIRLAPSLGPAPDTRAEVTLGVVDLDGSLRKEHEVFASDPAHPTWHSVNRTELALEPDPLPASLPDSSPAELDVFLTGAHHATHVAALIAGRESPCWSGLLPQAKLIFIPSGTEAQMAEGIRDAKFFSVRTFNVSLDLGVESSGLRRVVEESEDNVFFVVAAGNAEPGERGTDLNDNAPPEQARWSEDFGNVVVVTAADDDGDLLDEANFGKRYVDLVTLGREVVSASEPGAFGPASGTSQAAPLAAAAAALLAEARPIGAGFSPGNVRARLLATARWDDELRGKVWGGALDFAAAVRLPLENLLVTGTPPAGSLQSFEAKPNARLTLLASPLNYQREDSFTDSSLKTFRFDRVLAMQRLANGTYRIVLKHPEQDTLTILLDAEFAADARLPCAEIDVWDAALEDFVEAPERCADGVVVRSIQDYVRGDRYDVKWGRGEPD